MTKRSTREQIEEKADTLFYEGGFEATSFADIANAVGISRGNFYHHFKSKDDILDAVITRRLVATGAMLENWEADASPEIRIIAFIQILITNRTNIMAFGCPIGTLNTELTKLEHAAKSRATEIFDIFRDWLTIQFAAMGHREDAEALALHLLGRSQGVAVMASTFRDEGFLRSEVASLEDWLQRLANQLKNKVWDEMFIVLLKFSNNKAAAPEFMAAHNEWIAQGFADGVFQCMGSLVPAGGGALLAFGESRDMLEIRVNTDPFVQNEVVIAEITEVDVKKTVNALDFLKGDG